MNSPKLTNILLIVLIAFNLLIFAVAGFRHHHHRNFARNDYRGRKHDSFGHFHRGFEAYRGNYGGFHGGFRDCYRNNNCNCANM